MNIRTTYKDVVNDLSSKVLLECTKAYDGVYDMGIGRFIPYAYNIGDKLPRRKVFLIEENWKLATI